MHNQIRIRRGTKTHWESVNPVLALAEIGLEYELDSSNKIIPIFKAKVGDGTTPWKRLPYFGFNETDLTGDTGGNTSTLPVGTEGALALVPELGLYRYSASSTELADGELVIKPASGTGRWILTLPSTDFMFASRRGARRATETGTVPLSFGAIAAGGFVDKAVTLFPMVGEGYMVYAAPRSSLARGLVYNASISAPGVVALRLINETTAAITPAASDWEVTIYRPENAA